MLVGLMSTCCREKTTDRFISADLSFQKKELIAIIIKPWKINVKLDMGYFDTSHCNTSQAVATDQVISRLLFLTTAVGKNNNAKNI